MGFLNFILYLGSWVDNEECAISPLVRRANALYISLYKQSSSCHVLTPAFDSNLQEAC